MSSYSWHSINGSCSAVSHYDIHTGASGSHAPTSAERGRSHTNAEVSGQLNIKQTFLEVEMEQTFSKCRFIHRVKVLFCTTSLSTETHKQGEHKRLQKCEDNTEIVTLDKIIIDFCSASVLFKKHTNWIISLHHSKTVATYWLIFYEIIRHKLVGFYS